MAEIFKFHNSLNIDSNIKINISQTMCHGKCHSFRFEDRRIVFRVNHIVNGFMIRLNVSDFILLFNNCE